MSKPASTALPELSSTIRSYLQYAASFRGLAPPSIAAYEGDVKRFLDWAAEHHLPDDAAKITRQDLQRYINTLGGLSPATVRRAAYSLSGLFAHLQREGRITVNPAAGLVLPKRHRRLPNVPTDQQAQRLLDATANTKESAILHLALMAGLRRSEILQLDREAVSLDCSELTILGKGQVERKIPLPVAAQRALTLHLEEEGIKHGPVFRNKVGRRMTSTTLQRAWRRLLRRAGLDMEGFVLHGCRGYYATALLRCTGDLGAVMRLMGHASLETTSCYIGLNTSRVREAISNFPIGGSSPVGDAS